MKVFVYNSLELENYVLFSRKKILFVINMLIQNTCFSNKIIDCQIIAQTSRMLNALLHEAFDVIENSYCHIVRCERKK